MSTITVTCALNVFQIWQAVSCHWICFKAIADHFSFCVLSIWTGKYVTFAIACVMKVSLILPFAGFSHAGAERWCCNIRVMEIETNKMKTNRKMPQWGVWHTVFFTGLRNKHFNIHMTISDANKNTFFLLLQFKKTFYIMLVLRILRRAANLIWLWLHLMHLCS